MHLPDVLLLPVPHAQLILKYGFDSAQAAQEKAEPKEDPAASHPWKGRASEKPLVRSPARPRGGTGIPSVRGATLRWRHREHRLSTCADPPRDAQRAPLGGVTGTVRRHMEDIPILFGGAIGD